jgi:hypothetical protein
LIWTRIIQRLLRSIPHMLRSYKVLNNIQTVTDHLFTGAWLANSITNTELERREPPVPQTGKSSIPFQFVAGCMQTEMTEYHSKQIYRFKTQNSKSFDRMWETPTGPIYSRVVSIERKYPYICTIYLRFRCMDDK